jgi:hypothetical protein
MMATGNDRRGLQFWRTAAEKDLVANGGMCFHDFELVFSQPAWFQENLVTGSDFPQVVHRSSLKDQLLFLDGQLQSGGNQA